VLLKRSMLNRALPTIFVFGHNIQDTKKNNFFKYYNIF